MSSLKQKVTKGVVWTLLEKRVGSYAHIAAGAVITRLILPHVLAAGVPAQIKKD